MFAASAAFACSSASSGVIRTYAFKVGLKRSMRSRYARVSSIDETSRLRTAAAWSSADAKGSLPVNGADSDRGVGRRGKSALECRCVVRWDGDEKAAARLSVAQHQLVEFQDAPPPDLA